MLVKFTVVIYIIFIEIKKSNVKRAKYFNWNYVKINAFTICIYVVHLTYYNLTRITNVSHGATKQYLEKISNDVWNIHVSKNIGINDQKYRSTMNRNSKWLYVKIE